MSRIYLVTGAAGFLGSNICAQLLEKGEKVRALVLPNDKSVKYIPEEVEICLGDLCDVESLEKFFKALSDYFDILKKLDLRVFTMEFMNLYGENSLFAMENYQRLLEVIITSSIFNIRGYKDQLVDSVINKDALDLYTEITRVLSR